MSERFARAGADGPYHPDGPPDQGNSAEPDDHVSSLHPAEQAGQALLADQAAQTSPAYPAYPADQAGLAALAPGEQPPSGRRTQRKVAGWRLVGQIGRASCGERV